MRRILAIALGVAATEATAAVDRYVADAGTNDAAGGFTNWVGASTCLQAAIDASGPGDTVWVENGFVTDAGGRIGPIVGSLMTNRIVIDKAITVRSVSGDTNTPPRIVGAWDPNAAENEYGCGPAAVRCLYMARGAMLIGFMLTNGATLRTGDGGNYRDTRGAGVFGPDSGGALPILSNCIITGNSASSWGGGAMQVDLFNCVLSRNISALGVTHTCNLYNCQVIENKGGSSTATAGAGPNCNVYNSTLRGNSDARYAATRSANLYNCTVVGNTATDTGRGGGVCGGSAEPSTLTNSIVYFNTAATPAYSNWNNVASAAYTCTAPDPGGAGNITDDPRFVAAFAGDYRLRGNSPCIDKGFDFDWMSDPADPQGRNLDLAGGPRIRGERVDMGAYEYVAMGTIYSCNL
jgi:hypothetical protein